MSLNHDFVITNPLEEVRDLSFTHSGSSFYRASLKLYKYDANNYT